MDAITKRYTKGDVAKRPSWALSIERGYERPRVR
jgi:hypothetical protein